MNEILVKSGVEIDLGKRGEHLARCIVFDISGWQKTYGEGSVHLLHQRNGDKAPYPCVVETDGTYVRWLLSETDVDVAGRGRAELQYFVDEARVKSETWNTRTNRSMNNEGPIPEEPAENWLNTMLQLGTETQENAEVAEKSAEIAKQSAEMAKNSEEYVAGVVESVVADSLAEIQESVDAAAENAETARASCAVAVESAEAAEANALSASASEQAAKDAQAAAEQARDEAQELAGGDYVPTSREVNGKPLSSDVNLTAADVGAAPAGYGLGGVATYITDANSATKCGFYRFDDAANVPFGFGVLISVARYDGVPNQIAFGNAGVSAGKIAIRHKDSGVWSEWKELATTDYALSKNGDYMYGALNVNTDGGEVSANVFTYDGNAQFRNRRDDNTFSTFILPDGNTDTHPMYVKYRNGVEADFGNILHTGNKPAAVYYGTGSTGERVIETGSFADIQGCCCALYGGAGEMAIVTPYGAFYRSADNVLSTSDITFNSGKITFKSTTTLNTSGYYYQYLVL